MHWLSNIKVISDRCHHSSAVVTHVKYELDLNNLIGTVETPYNTNVGVQKIPDRAILKPVVVKRNNTNP